jgi:hypothetical protein
MERKKDSPLIAGQRGRDKVLHADKSQLILSTLTGRSSTPFFELYKTSGKAKPHGLRFVRRLGRRLP